MKATKSQLTVFTAVIITLLGIGAIVLAQEKPTYLSTDPFEISHTECEKIENGGCGWVNISGMTLKTVIEKMNLQEPIVLNANDWKKHMLDEEVPVGLSFKFNFFPDPFAISKQNCIDKGWVGGVCKTTIESDGVLTMQRIIDVRKTTIKRLRLLNGWDEDLTPETLVPIGSTFATP
jgi:hypothetical protein